MLGVATAILSLLLLLSRFSCVTLCDPIDGSPPGSPAPGILQARVLEWVAIAFSILALKVYKSSDKDGTMKLPEPLCH